MQLGRKNTFRRTLITTGITMGSKCHWKQSTACRHPNHETEGTYIWYQ